MPYIDIKGCEYRNTKVHTHMICKIRKKNTREMQKNLGIWSIKLGWPFYSHMKLYKRMRTRGIVSEENIIRIILFVQKCVFIGKSLRCLLCLPHIPLRPAHLSSRPTKHSPLFFFSYPQRVDQISPVASTRSGPGSRSWQHLLVLEPYILARVLQSVYAIVAGRRSCHGCWPAAI